MPPSMVFTGSIFVISALAAFYLIGWNHDEWLLAPLAIAHVFFATRGQVKLTRRIVTYHYIILVLALLGLLLPVFLHLPGPTNNWLSQTAQTIAAEWLSLQGCIHALVFFLASLAIFTAIYLMGLAAIPLSKIEKRNPKGSLFVFSVLVIPCDFAIQDVVGLIGAERPTEVAGSVIAGAISSLVLPLFFHLSVIGILFVISFQLKHQLIGLPPSR